MNYIVPGDGKEDIEGECAVFHSPQSIQKANVPRYNAAKSCPIRSIIWSLVSPHDKSVLPVSRTRVG
jgi:hypothetical protein